MLKPWETLTKKRVFVNWFISPVFCSPTIYFGPLSRGHPHSPNVNHCVSTISPQRLLRGQKKIGFLGPVECLVEILNVLGTFWFLYRLTWSTSAIHQMVNWSIGCVTLWNILQNFIYFSYEVKISKGGGSCLKGVCF